MQCVHVETLELSFVRRFIRTVSTVTPHCCRLLKQCLSTTCSCFCSVEKPFHVNLEFHVHRFISKYYVCYCSFGKFIMKDILVSGALWIWLVGVFEILCLLNLTADVFLSRCLEEEAGASWRQALHSISAPPVVWSQRLQHGATFSSWIVDYALRHIWFCYVFVCVCVFEIIQTLGEKWNMPKELVWGTALQYLCFLWVDANKSYFECI